MTPVSKIRLENVSKIFGAHPARALKLLDEGHNKAEVQERQNVTVGTYDVTLAVEPGETFVLMGLSGSGKSTLLRLMNRLHTPTRGSVIVNGSDITRLKMRDLIRFRRKNFGGMVFQGFAILPHRSTLGNVEFGLELQGVPKKLRHERALEVIELVGLKGYEKAYPHTLSGGMQQRVGLARALALEEDILLMDEPFSALDPLIRRELQDELLRLRQRVQKTIVFVTHDLDEALKLGNRIAIMRDGVVQQLGTPQEIIAKPATPYVEAFVAGVNRSEILTARDIMKPSAPGVRDSDSVAEALETIHRKRLPGVFLLSADGSYRGYVDAGMLEANAGATLGDLPLREPCALRLETPLQEVIVLASKRREPLAVLDPNGKPLGMITKDDILDALAGNAGALGEERL